MTLRLERRKPGSTFAIDCRGAFLGGVFAGRDLCGPFGCAGSVTSFTESGGVLGIALTAGGACPSSPPSVPRSPPPRGGTITA